MYLSNKNEDYNYLNEEYKKVINYLQDKKLSLYDLLEKYKEAINVYKLEVDKDPKRKKIIMIS